MKKSNYANQIIEKLADKLEPYQVKIEFVLLLLFFIGLILKELDVETSSIIIIVSLSSFAILYFIMSFWKRSTRKNIFSGILYQIPVLSFSSSILGLLYIIQNYQGGFIMTRIGLSSMMFAVFGLAIYKWIYQKNEKLLDGNVIRALIILLFYLGIYVTIGFPEQQEFEYPSKNQEMKIETSIDTVTGSIH